MLLGGSEEERRQWWRGLHGSQTPPQLSRGSPAIVSGEAMLSAFYNKEKFIEEMYGRQKLGITD